MNINNQKYELMLQTSLTVLVFSLLIERLHLYYQAYDRFKRKYSRTTMEIYMYKVKSVIRDDQNKLENVG